MKKYFKISAIVLFVIMTLLSCNKENRILPNKTKYEKSKPIASMSKQREMTYLVSVDDLQTKMDKDVLSSKEMRQFIVEDWYIDLGDGTDLNPLTLVVSVFDVLNEQVITHFFMRECLITENVDGITYYYINPELISGSYQLASANVDTRETGRGTLFTVFNGNIINVETDALIVDRAHPHPYWHVDCASSFCASVCEREGTVNADGSYSYGCKQCQRPCEGYVGACVANSINVGERILSWFSYFSISIF